MITKFYDDIDKFYDAAFPFLIKHEAENNLPLSILRSLKENPYRYGEEMPLLISILLDDDVKLISLRTPPFDLIISFIDDLTSIDILIEELLKRKEILPGVLSFKDAADKFGKKWCEKNSLNLQLLRNERIYQLTEVTEATLGNRRLEVGTKTYQDIILKWTREMMIEALVDVKEEELQRNYEIYKAELEENKSQIYILFENGEPVSMARKAGKTPNGNFVNLVYTPPSLRRRGYATECVAKLSKLLLDEGNKYCFLFTDLSNPTSNSIYQQIGYRPVIDANHYRFQKP